MAALENGGAYARAKIPEFSLAIQGYDESSEAFVSNLLPVRTCGVISEGCNGTNEMTHHKALAWKASFNNARNCHPIVRNQIWKRNGKIFRQKQHVNLPEGNACAVFMVENIPSEDLHRKERKEMEEKKEKMESIWAKHLLWRDTSIENFKRLKNQSQKQYENHALSASSVSNESLRMCTQITKGVEFTGSEGVLTQQISIDLPVNRSERTGVISTFEAASPKA